MGTSCPPSITRLAIRDALMVGEAVQTKNSLTKKPNETQRTQYYCTNIHKKRSPVWNSFKKIGGDLLFHKQVQYHRRCEASAWLRFCFTNYCFFGYSLLSGLRLLSLQPLCRHWNYYDSYSSLLRFCFPVGYHSINGSGFWALFSQKTNSPLLWLLKRRHGLRAPLKSN